MTGPGLDCTGLDCTGVVGGGPQPDSGNPRSGTVGRRGIRRPLLLPNETVTYGSPGGDRDQLFSRRRP